MRKKIIIPAAAGALLLLLIAAVLFLRGRERQVPFSEEYVMAEELPALLSFTYHDQGEWETEIGRIVRGKMSYRELSELLEQLGVKDYVTYEDGRRFSAVPRAVFFQVYAQLLDLLDVDGRVSTADLVFVGNAPKEDPGISSVNTGAGQESDASAGQTAVRQSGAQKQVLWLTQQGYLPVKGGAQYINHYDMYQAYMLDGAVIGLESRLTTSVTWENVFVHTAGDEKAELLFEKERISIEIPTLKETITDTICDLEWKNNAVSAIYKKEEMIQGTVLSYNEEQIEIAGYGALKHSGSLKIYKTYGTVEQLEESKLMIGNLVADFVVAKGLVCGIILKEPAEIKDIRVLLLNGSEPYYPELYVVSDEETTVTFGDSVQQLNANTLITASGFFADSQEGYVSIDTATDQGNLYLSNEKGERVSLGYPGNFKLRRYPEGYCVVNELSLETYLAGVVPSEMPAAYEMEALRVQAVCARSYACIQLTNDAYAAFGANVDDSTSYQVYNKQARDERSTLAVKDTIGEVIKYNGDIAEAYYYSTSCGLSQDMSVWNAADDSNGYLASISLLTDGERPDFSDEAVFAQFIQDKARTAYDSDGVYFRWQANVDLNAAADKVNKALAERQAVNPANVQVFDTAGNASTLTPAQLGAVTGIVPEERSAGGVLKKLRIQYEKGTILLTTEYNIRKILGVAAASMRDKNDKEITVMTLLPSAAFTVTAAKQGYLLYGGGYGHGIGMSQNGANGMAKAGLTYVEILQKFYQNITIENIYNGQ